VVLNKLISFSLPAFVERDAHQTGLDIQIECSVRIGL
jgi:hypothetical protein